ncbi:MAG TPA: hypothetical protein VGS09_10610 [Actinomycetota bacterium]|jgi:hypothetical protein|nr:hypothetical protein [Actinomycetota bacterium]
MSLARISRNDWKTGRMVRGPHGIYAMIPGLGEALELLTESSRSPEPMSWSGEESFLRPGSHEEPKGQGA